MITDRHVNTDRLPLSSPQVKCFETGKWVAVEEAGELEPDDMFVFAGDQLSRVRRLLFLLPL